MEVYDTMDKLLPLYLSSISALYTKESKNILPLPQSEFLEYIILLQV
jgi:hypothetical protein